MKEKKRTYKLQPAVFGVFICVMLIISRYLSSASASSGLLSLNTLLIIVILFLCLHLVRRTSELFQEHVWNSLWTLILLLMPLFNLLVTGVQLIADIPVLSASRAFSAALIFISMPIFICLYFAFLSFKLPKNRPLHIMSILLLVLNGVYVVFRLFSVVVFPLVREAGKAISPAVGGLFSHYPDLSLVIYLFSIACFIVSADALKKENESLL